MNTKIKTPQNYIVLEDDSRNGICMEHMHKTKCVIDEIYSNYPSDHKKVISFQSEVDVGTWTGLASCGAPGKKREKNPDVEI